MLLQNKDSVNTSALIVSLFRELYGKVIQFIQFMVIN